MGASPDPDAVRFLQEVLARAGVDCTPYRAAPLMRRLPACLRALRARTLADARQRLEREPRLLRPAASALLIGVTEFFRDPPVFEYLNTTLLPALAAERSPLKAWSAGCADGAELYSLAMLLARRGMLAGSLLVGTDCREGAIQAASRGWFDTERLRPVPSNLRQTCFFEEQGGSRVCGTIREAVQWQRADILTGDCAGASPFDLVLCRNLAIYFEPPAARRLWSRLADALRPGGVLVVGKAERPDRQSGWRRLAPCVFEKRR